MNNQFLQIDRFEGVADFVASDNQPVTVLQKLINFRPFRQVGKAIKRLPYLAKLTTGLTSLNAAIEFTNKNDDVELLIADQNALEVSINTAGSYGALGSIANDERTGGSTIDGDMFFPIVANQEIRSGAGIGASTDRPVWYGYVESRDRFNSAENRAAGKYLEEQYPDRDESAYTDLLFPSVTDNASKVSGQGLTLDQQFRVFVSPVIDGYQLGFPERVAITTNSNDKGSLTILFGISSLAPEKFMRITHLDVFVSNHENAFAEDLKSFPSYFVERVDLNEDGDYFLEIDGNVGVTTANKIVIDSYADWQTFSAVGFFIYDVTNGNYYRVTAEAFDTPVSGQVEFTVTPTASADGAATLRFMSRWFSESSTYKYAVLYDSYYKKLQGEMHDYLGIPDGDQGIDDFRYLYSANNGNYSLYGGFPDDTNYAYWSTVNQPDIVPSLNILRFASAIKGVIALGSDFMVFDELGVSRITIYGNEQASQADNYLEARLTHHKSIVKLSDDEIVFMSYDGPYFVSGRSTRFLGKPLSGELWRTLTNAEKEACVMGYNSLNDEVWISFPTYTTSPFSNGLIVVLDLEAYRSGSIAPFWYVKTDFAVYDFVLNKQGNLLGCGRTKVVDFDGSSGAETVDASMKLKLLKSPIPRGKVRWKKLFIDATTNDSITAKIYLDESASATTLSLNSSYRAFLRYLSRTIEIEITTPASTNEAEIHGLLLSYNPMRERAG